MRWGKRRKDWEVRRAVRWMTEGGGQERSRKRWNRLRLNDEETGWTDQPGWIKRQKNEWQKTTERRWNYHNKKWKIRRKDKTRKKRSEEFKTHLWHLQIRCLHGCASKVRPPTQTLFFFVSSMEQVFYFIMFISHHQIFGHKHLINIQL